MRRITSCCSATLPRTSNSRGCGHGRRAPRRLVQLLAVAPVPEPLPGEISKCDTPGFLCRGTTIACHRSLPCALGPLVLWNKAVLHCRINRNARFPELVVGTAVKSGGMGWVDWGLWC